VVRDAVFEKGQSRRIWGELYKVVDSSDVVIQVLDARDPAGTRCRHLEQHLKRNARHKHLLLLLNKCDLVPAWVTKRWLHSLSREYPTLAFHASITNPFGKGSLLSLLRQLARLRSDKQYISVGLVGYPNVGKSSVINTLRSKKVGARRFGAHPAAALASAGEVASRLRGRPPTPMPAASRPSPRGACAGPPRAGVQGGPRARGDQGVAVHHPYEAHLPHRLPRRGVQQDRGQPDRHCAQGRGAGGEPGGRHRACGGGAAPREARVPAPRVPHDVLDRRRGLPHAGGAPDR
jgi:hypothetical protein